jgi:hypothetical protein
MIKPDDAIIRPPQLSYPIKLALGVYEKTIWRFGVVLGNYDIRHGYRIVTSSNEETTAFTREGLLRFPYNSIALAFGEFDGHSQGFDSTIPDALRDILPLTAPEAVSTIITLG